MEIDSSFSEPETQFVPQEGDEDTLWAVIEITAERGREYKVKWKGTDPNTNKPWPQSWVPKHDCTPDLVNAWKLKQRRKSTATASGKSARASTSSRARELLPTSKASSSKTITKSPTKSTASTSISAPRKARNQSTSTSTSTTTARPQKPSPAIPDHVWESPPKSHLQAVVELDSPTKKRKRSVASFEPDPESFLLDLSSRASEGEEGKEVERPKAKTTGKGKAKAKAEAGATNRKDTSARDDVRPPAKKKRKVDTMSRLRHPFSSEDENDGNVEVSKSKPHKTSSGAGLGATISASKLPARKTAAPSRESSTTSRAKANGKGKEKAKGISGVNDWIIEDEVDEGQEEEEEVEVVSKKVIGGKRKGKEKAKGISEIDKWGLGDEDDEGQEEEEEMEAVVPKEVISGKHRLRGSTGSSVGDSAKGKGKGKGKEKEKPKLTNGQSALKQPLFLPAESSEDGEDIEENDSARLDVEPPFVETRDSVKGDGEEVGVDAEQIWLASFDRAMQRLQKPLEEGRPPVRERHSRGNSATSSRQSGSKSGRMKKVLLPTTHSDDDMADSEGDSEASVTAKLPTNTKHVKNAVATSASVELAGVSRKTAVSVPLNGTSSKDGNEDEQPQGQRKSSSSSKSHSKSKSPHMADPRDDAQPTSNQTSRSNSETRANLPRAQIPVARDGSNSRNGRKVALRSDSVSNGVLPKAKLKDGPVSTTASSSTSGSGSGAVPPKLSNSKNTSRGVRSRSPQPGSGSSARSSNQPREEAVVATSRFVSDSIHISPEDEQDRLSPASWARLKEFDVFLASLPPDSETEEVRGEIDQWPNDVDVGTELQYPDVEPSSAQDQDVDKKPGLTLPPITVQDQHSQGTESFVPETDLSNNTQQSLPQSSQLGPEQQPEDVPMSPSTPPRSPPLQRSPSSLIARMRPKSPAKKQLRPIPVITPSKFAPHLPRSNFGDSIEQWSSPEKSTDAVRGSEAPLNQRSAVDGVTGLKDRSTLVSSQDTDIWEQELRQRGLEMAHQAKLRKLEENGGKVMKKKTLEEIIANGKGKQIFSVPVQTKPVPEPELESERADAFVEDDSMHVDESAEVTESIPSLEYPPGPSERVLSPPPPPVKPPESRSSSIPPRKSAIKEVLPSATARKRTTPPREDLRDRSPVPELAQTHSAELLLRETASELETIITTQRTENDSLLQEISALKEALAAATASVGSPAQEKLEAEKQVETLTQSLAAANAAKDAAEKNNEFFREQYAKASSFVSSTRTENEALEKRVQIAETQAKEGVALIKATYERRIQELEDESKVWKRMGNWAMKKDMETNDDIRRRAAEEPELRRESEQLKRKVQDLVVQVQELKEENEALELEVKEKEDQRSAAAAQTEAWRLQAVRLTVELTEKQELTSLTSSDLVYRCHYRLTADSPACVFVCKTTKELENHVIRHAM